MLPSLGRGASDFATLAAALRPDHAVVAIEPRPVSGDAPTLGALAAHVVSRADRAGIDRFHLVGHAFGNRLARCVTADHPERVASLTLLAAGGRIPPSEDIHRSLLACFDESLPPDEHLRHVRRAFFAPANDPSVWAGGWMADVALEQGAAVGRTPAAHWWDAAAPRVLVVQGLQDAVAPPENGRRYVADHAEVAALVEVDGAGHALLPEQPERLAEVVGDFLA